MYLAVEFCLSTWVSNEWVWCKLFRKVARLHCPTAQRLIVEGGEEEERVTSYSGHGESRISHMYYK